MTKIKFWKPLVVICLMIVLTGCAQATGDQAVIKNALSALNKYENKELVLNINFNSPTGQALGKTANFQVKDNKNMKISLYNLDPTNKMAGSLAAEQEFYIVDGATYANQNGQLVNQSKIININAGKLFLTGFSTIASQITSQCTAQAKTEAADATTYPYECDAPILDQLTTLLNQSPLANFGLKAMSSKFMTNFTLTPETNEFQSMTISGNSTIDVGGLQTDSAFSLEVQANEPSQTINYEVPALAN